MPRHRFGFDFKNADWCKWLCCIAILVILILSIMTYDKVSKNKQGYVHLNNQRKFSPRH